MLACDMSSQLLNIAPDPEAKLYYSTMVQDESRHTEAWMKLVIEVGGTAERDPHLDKMAHMTLEADTLEEKVFLMQVFYERLIIGRFPPDRALGARHRARPVATGSRPTTGSTTAPAWPTRRCCSRARASRRSRSSSTRRPPADVHRARALAAEGARLDRRGDVRPRRPAAARGHPARRSPRELARARRRRHPDPDSIVSAAWRRR